MRLMILMHLTDLNAESEPKFLDAREVKVFEQVKEQVPINDFILIISSLSFTKLARIVKYKII